MNGKNCKTQEEHREYLFEIVRLQLFFLHKWCGDHPEEPVRHVLRKRVDIYRKTSINRGGMNPKIAFFLDPRWLKLEGETKKLFLLHRDDRGAFEEEAFRLFRPFIEARVERDYHERPYVLDYKCGSLNFDRPDRKKVSFIHIANSLSPRSIFSDPAHIPSCLEALTVMARKAGAQAVCSETWINNLTPWLECFPAEWRENMGPEIRDVRWHFGFWGQFINARGTFNTKAGVRMRETGELPCYPRYSRCSLDSLEAHLKAMKQDPAFRT